MIDLEVIRERLIEAIKQSELTQTEIAQKIGVGYRTVSHYVKGDKLPSLDTFANLCRALDLDPAYMLGLSD